MRITQQLDDLELGRSGEPVDIATGEDSRLAIVAMVRQARRGLNIVTRDLDPRVYDNPGVVSAFKDFALDNRRSTVRIIVRDTTRAISRGHRLVDLQRRLPTHITIRTPAKEHLDYNCAFVLADNVAVLFRNYADRYEGIVNFNDPQLAEELGNLFSEMWEHATAPAELRRLTI